ncbi:hypothetical protein [Streptomyces sp. NPDC003273]|uniref:hypothetical protein n=1 Tax=Streptomyces sp. NPDC003273 TaxID=3364678 RepID=UPI0036932B6F
MREKPSVYSLRTRTSEDASGQPHGSLSAPQAALIASFPLVGSMLYITEAMPLSQIFQFLAGTGAIGTAVTLTASTIRRKAVAAFIRRMLAAEEQ